MPRILAWSTSALEARAAVADRLVAKGLTMAIRPITADIRNIVTAAAEPVPVVAPPPPAPPSAAPAVAMLGMEGIVASWNAFVDAELFPYVVQTFMDSAEDIAGGVGTALDTVMAPVGNQYAIEYLSQAKNRLTSIGDTLWNNARAELVTGMEQGYDMSQMALAVKSAVGVTEPWAMVIARTEVIMAANAGSIIQMRNMGFEPGTVTKEWLSTHDVRTRPAHEDADGQSVDLDASFTVGKEALDFPGDPTGQPGNVINCRCAMAFDFQDAPLTSAFDESQVKRDSDGKFAKKNSAKITLPDFGGMENDQIEDYIQILTPKDWHSLSGDEQDVLIDQAGDLDSIGMSEASAHIVKLQVSDPDEDDDVDDDVVKAQKILNMTDAEWQALSAAEKDAYEDFALEVWTQGGDQDKALSNKLHDLGQVAKGEMTLKQQNQAVRVIEGYDAAKWKDALSVVKQDLLTKAYELDSYGIPEPLAHIKALDQAVLSNNIAAASPAAATVGPPVAINTNLVWKQTFGDGQVVAISSSGKNRIVWDAGSKKFLEQTLAMNGTWKTTDTHTKKSLYETHKGVSGWHEPVGTGVAATPVAPSTTSVATSVPAVTSPIAAPADPDGYPLPANLKSTGKKLGTHGAVVYKDSATGQEWLFKPTAPGKQYTAAVDLATAEIQAKAGLKTPKMTTVTLDGKFGSLQEMVPGKPAFPGTFDASKLSKKELQDLLKQQVLDWFIGNHDSHKGNFVKDANGDIVGIDKGQAFKFYAGDQLSTDFHINEHESIYAQLWKQYQDGKVDITADDLNAAQSTITALQSITQAELAEILFDYSVGAASAGDLLKKYSNGQLKNKPSLKINDGVVFLHEVEKRQKALFGDFMGFYLDQQGKKAAKGNLSTPTPIPTPTVTGPASDEVTGPAWGPFKLPIVQGMQIDYGVNAHEDNSEYAAQEGSKYTQATFKVADLHPTQDDDGEDWGDGEGDAKPFVITMGGKHYLIDGHHRAVKAGKNGSLNVWHMNLDAPGVPTSGSTTSAPTSTSGFGPNSTYENLVGNTPITYSPFDMVFESNGDTTLGQYTFVKNGSFNFGVLDPDDKPLGVIKKDAVTAEWWFIPTTTGKKIVLPATKSTDAMVQTAALIDASEGVVSGLPGPGSTTSSLPNVSPGGSGGVSPGSILGDPTLVKPLGAGYTYKGVMYDIGADLTHDGFPMLNANGEVEGYLAFTDPATNEFTFKSKFTTAKQSFTAPSFGVAIAHAGELVLTHNPNAGVTSPPSGTPDVSLVKALSLNTKGYKDYTLDLTTLPKSTQGSAVLGPNKKVIGYLRYDNVATNEWSFTPVDGSPKTTLNTPLTNMAFATIVEKLLASGAPTAPPPPSPPPIPTISPVVAKLMNAPGGNVLGDQYSVIGSIDGTFTYKGVITDMTKTTSNGDTVTDVDGNIIGYIKKENVGVSSSTWKFTSSDGSAVVFYATTSDAAIAHMSQGLIDLYPNLSGSSSPVSSPPPIAGLYPTTPSVAPTPSAAPSIPSLSTHTKKKLTTTVMYSTPHGHLEVVAVNQLGERILWNASLKKYTYQELDTTTGVWKHKGYFGKGEAHKKWGKDTHWFAPNANDQITSTAPATTANPLSSTGMLSSLGGTSTTGAPTLAPSPGTAPKPIKPSSPFLQVPEASPETHLKAAQATIDVPGEKLPPPAPPTPEAPPEVPVLAGLDTDFSGWGYETKQSVSSKANALPIKNAETNFEGAIKALTTGGHPGMNLAQVLAYLDAKNVKFGGEPGFYTKQITTWLKTPEGKKRAIEIMTAAKKNSSPVGLLPYQKGVDLHPELRGVPSTTDTEFPHYSVKQMIEMQSKQKPWTGAQKAALKSYTSSSDDMNRYAREGIGSESVKEKVKQAQNAMQPLPFPMTVVRGTKSFFGPTQTALPTAAQLKSMIGVTVRDKAFLSTSVEGGGFGGQYKLHIELPTGTPTAFVEGISTYAGGNEKEMLLAAGLKYEILAVTEGHPIIVRMRVVP